MNRPPNPWTLVFSPQPHADTTLLCFPHAGGSPAGYRPWCAPLAPRTEVVAVQLPGRAGRFREPSYTSMGALADAAASELHPGSERPYAMFGHSLGGLMAYEVILRWMDAGHTLPAALILSGVHAPHITPHHAPIHELPDGPFVDALREWNGTAPEVLAHEELLQLLLPSLRADFQVYETYRPSRREVLPIPLIVLGGDADPSVDRTELDAWAAYSSVSETTHLFPGGHFFLHEHQASVLQIIADTLATLRKA